MTNKIKIFVGAEGIEPSHRNHFFITLRYPSRSHAPFFKPPYSHEPDRWLLIKKNTYVAAAAAKIFTSITLKLEFIYEQRFF